MTHDPNRWMRMNAAQAAAMADERFDPDLGDKNIGDTINRCFFVDGGHNGQCYVLYEQAEGFLDSDVLDRAMAILDTLGGSGTTQELYDTYCTERYEQFCAGTLASLGSVEIHDCAHRNEVSALINRVVPLDVRDEQLLEEMREHAAILDFDWDGMHAILVKATRDPDTSGKLGEFCNLIEAIRTDAERA